MPFKIQELKKFLSHIIKYKVENINLKSDTLILTVNTKKELKKFSINTLNPLTKFKQTSHPKPVVNSDVKIDIPKTKIERYKYFTIVSPMIGTFYRSPAPNEKPFININDAVNTGQTVCIIEAMKLMNEIESEVNGQIVEILVKDGDIVDCGQALIKIQQDKKL